MKAMETNIDKLEFETPQQKTWITNFMKLAPEIIEEIIEEIQEVEGMRYKIGLLPSIVLLVGKIIHERSILIELKDPDNIILLIELILDTMIEIEFIYLPTYQKILIEKTIADCLELLKYSILKNTKDNPCCNFWLF